MNLFTILFLIALASSIIVQCFLAQRHIRYIRKHRQQVPTDFKDKISIQEHQKAADYTQAKVKTGLMELTITSILLLIWTIGGGLQFLDDYLRPLGFSEIITGTIFILSFMAISAILELPMSYYRNFRIEEAFGFNKMTLKVFVTDIFKDALIGLLINTPLFLAILWIMSNTGDYWWLYTWLTLVVFTLFQTWAYPAFIAPIYNKFRPLENEELKIRIENLLKRNGFKSQGVFVMDGSLRSTHGNAYFAGFGNNKRIVFFDTLIDILSYDEIEAVLAHELGHFKRNHVKKLTLLITLIMFIGLSILGWLIDKPWFFAGLGVTAVSDYMALVLFFLIAPAFSFFIMPLIKLLTRKYEFEADDFAISQAKVESLIHALVTLFRENANTLTPDPMYSAYYDSHPPAPIRIAHLKSKFA